ncbi:MAG: hypothetical protein QMD21_07285 [Candidatus Thermoplasmatota archaeon]|nr:hypothetical protein [Candidatus Thermoplasmatota archaeon]
MQTIIGGLHVDDFEYAVRLGDWLGKALLAFQRSVDGYHWQAVYDDYKLSFEEKRTDEAGVSEAIGSDLERIEVDEQNKKEADRFDRSKIQLGTCRREKQER